MNYIARMEKALPDYIKENKDLRQALLKQDGFMKYVAERIEAGDDGLSIYARYQGHVFTIYCKANSWKPDTQLMSDDELWLKALGPDNHLLKEFRYLMAMERSLEGMPEEAANAVRDFHDGYMGYAWREFFERRNPEHATDVGFYKMFMDQFLSPNGLANRCLDIVLKIHHGKGLTEIDRYDYYRIAEYYYFYFDEFEPQGKRAYDRLRRGVKEWLDGKDDEECRELAVDMLKKVRYFSQHIYNDEAACSLNGRQLPLEDKRWLRQTASRIGKVTKDACFYFSEFVNILAEVGHIWAARLLKEHKIDMHELEENFHSYLQPYNPGKDGFDCYYYIDHHYTTDSPNTCCVNNYDKAKELLYALHKIKRNESSEEQARAIAQPLVKMDASTGECNNRKKPAKRTPPRVDPTLPKTLAYYTSNNNDDKNKARKERVEAIFQLWTNWGWIDKNTNAVDFHSFFSGTERYCNIVWTTNNAILTLLLDCLIKRTDIIREQIGCHVKPIIEKQFGKKRDDNYKKRVDEANKKRINITLFVLDTKNSFQIIYKEVEEKLSDNDKTLMIKYKDDEIAKIAKQEAMAGNLRISKSPKR